MANHSKYPKPEHIGEELLILHFPLDSDELIRGAQLISARNAIIMHGLRKARRYRTRVEQKTDGWRLYAERIR